jgi:hypothetical protein
LIYIAYKGNTKNIENTTLPLTFLNATSKITTKLINFAYIKQLEL